MAVQLLKPFYFVASKITPAMEATWNSLTSPLVAWHNSNVATCVNMTEPALPQDFYDNVTISKYGVANNMYRNQLRECKSQVGSFEAIATNLFIMFLIALVFFAPLVRFAVSQVSKSISHWIKPAAQSPARSSDGEAGKVNALESQARAANAEVHRLEQELIEARRNYVVLSQRIQKMKN